MQKLAMKLLSLLKNFIAPYIEKISYPVYDYATKRNLIEQININLNLCDKTQKRVLISYVCNPNIQFDLVTHPLVLHSNQIIYNFIKMGFCIDICFYASLDSYNRLKHNSYDVIFGFGEVYKQACRDNPNARKMCFVMENNPEIVKQKYEERRAYFKKRHPLIPLKGDFERTGLFDVDQFKISDCALLMTSSFNSLSFANYFSKFKLINSNAIFCSLYNFDEKIVRKYIEPSRNNFLWFGSHGLIHKGLDIVVDVFRKRDELYLNCYGIKESEYPLFDSIKGRNTINRGTINVQSEKYVTDIVLKHNFMILASCSEGMSTAVATCMAAGIIPIVTKETGLNSAPCIFELPDYTVESVEKVIDSVLCMSTDDILNLKKECYRYAHENFSLEHFNDSFQEAVFELLN